MTEASIPLCDKRGGNQCDNTRARTCPSAPEAESSDHGAADREHARDTLFAGGARRAGAFAFDAPVARVFDDMIRRSVPGYAQVLEITALAAARFYQPGTRCYDLGASLGATTFAMAAALAGTDARIVAADNAPAMVARLRERLAAHPPAVPVEVVEADLRSVRLAPASFVAAVFTLQFVPPADRSAVLERIRAALAPGGALLLAEKTAEPDAERAALLDALHRDFKRAHGYSEHEIAAKRESIERVLIPEPAAVHRARLERAGFAPVVECTRTLHFTSLLAVADGTAANERQRIHGSE